MLIYRSILLALSCRLLGLAMADECGPDPLEYSETIAMKVTKVGNVPAITSDLFQYNMAPMDNIANGSNVLYFLDQKYGMIYSYNVDSQLSETIFDKDNSTIPDGLTLDWDSYSAGQTYRVKALTSGPSNSIIVVFTSSTLPLEWNKADAKLPPPNSVGQWVCGPTPERLTSMKDIYRPGVIPPCSDSSAGTPVMIGYDVFVQYNVLDDSNGMLDLDNPRPFFVAETFVGPGHLGGGITQWGKSSTLLYSMGDCTIFGIDGSYAPQLDHEPCGKILKISILKKGKYDILAKGVRNIQQMRIYKRLGNKRKWLAFTDIGGVTAEEVNNIPLGRIAKGDLSVNFGWGRSLIDGNAREGTFYIERGNGLILGSEPKCDTIAPSGEKGYIQPWIQFGRTDTDFFYAISSMAVPTSHVSELKLLWSEFNTGLLMGTTNYNQMKMNVPVRGYKIKVYASDGLTYLEGGFNDLVKEELGSVGIYRGDPRLFHFPNGQAGVFIERTGVFYKLEEIPMPNEA